MPIKSLEYVALFSGLVIFLHNSRRFFRIVPTIDNLSFASFSATDNEVKK